MMGHPVHRGLALFRTIYPPGNADLRIGTMAGIGFVCTTPLVPRPPGRAPPGPAGKLGLFRTHAPDGNWVRFAHLTPPNWVCFAHFALRGPGRPVKLGSFRTIGPPRPAAGSGKLGLFCTIDPAPRLPGSPKLALFCAIALVACRGGPVRHGIAANWLCFAEVLCVSNSP
jgi:hypothetical protein